jgi:hypothetical protein
MSTTELTQDQVVAQFQKFALDNHVVLEGQRGAQNGKIVGDAIDRLAHISAATLAAAFESVRNQLTYKTPLEIEFPEHAQTIGSFSRPSRLINNDHNNIAILRYLKENRWSVTQERFTQVAVKIAASLEWDNPTQYVDPRQHTDNGGFAPKAETNRPYARHNHAKDAADVKPGHPAPLDASEVRWMHMAAEIKSNRHAVNAELDAVRNNESLSWAKKFSLCQQIINRGLTTGLMR